MTLSNGSLDVLLVPAFKSLVQFVPSLQRCRSRPSTYCDPLTQPKYEQEEAGSGVLPGSE